MAGLIGRMPKESMSTGLRRGAILLLDDFNDNVGLGAKLTDEPPERCELFEFDSTARGSSSAWYGVSGCSI